MSDWPGQCVCQTHTHTHGEHAHARHTQRTRTGREARHDPVCAHSMGKKNTAKTTHETRGRGTINQQTGGTSKAPPAASTRRCVPPPTRQNIAARGTGRWRGAHREIEGAWAPLPTRHEEIQVGPPVATPKGCGLGTSEGRDVGCVVHDLLGSIPGSVPVVLLNNGVQSTARASGTHTHILTHTKHHDHCRKTEWRYQPAPAAAGLATRALSTYLMVMVHTGGGSVLGTPFRILSVAVEVEPSQTRRKEGGGRKKARSSATCVY
jgi:hypothetical protein